MSETENDTVLPDADSHESAEVEANLENKPETVDLYNANDGILKRTGGPYLDQLEAEAAEVTRARKEDRDPDLDNPPAYSGTPLVPRAYLRETDTDHSQAALGGYVELENKPVDSFEVTPENNEPDPAQTDWDNDHQKVNAMQASAAYQKADSTVNTPDEEPADTDFANNKSWNV